MVDARRAAEKEEAKENVTKKPPMKMWEGKKVTHARDVDNAMVQDRDEVVVVGADVEAPLPQPGGRGDSQPLLQCHHQEWGEV